MKTGYLTVFLFLGVFVAESAFAQNQYYLPHLANGSIGGYIYKTTFILVNNSDLDASVVLYLSDNLGNPLTATLGRLGTDSQFIITLPAGSTAFLQTDGTGTGVVGAATVSATTPIGVSAVFTVYDSAGRYLTEAGVGSTELITDFVLPVDSSGSYLTGLAFFNPGPDAELTLALLYADGTLAATTTLPLNSFNHTSLFIASPQDLFPSFTNFRGSLSVHSTASIASVVLRQYQDKSTICYTSLPVVPRSSTKLAQNFAQVANGLYGNIRYQTAFLIFNISVSSADVSIKLTDGKGFPMTVTIPGNGPGTGTNSTFNFPLGPGASIILQTDGSGAGASGAATITSTMPVGASAVFTVLDSQNHFKTEAGVGDAPAMDSMTIPVDVSGGFDSGIAFFNSGVNSVPLTMKLIGANGVIANSFSHPLPANNQLPIFVDQLFPGTDNFKGSLAISAPGGVSATTLRQYGSGDTYTTLPTVPGVASGTAQVVPMLSKTVTGIHAAPGDPDIAVSANLNPGSTITGMVNGNGQPFGIAASAGGTVYEGQVNSLTRSYGIVVPDGTYALSAYFQPPGLQLPASLMVTYMDPSPVQVTSGAVHDITLPSITLITVSGTISGIGSLAASTTAMVVFTSNDNLTQGQFPIDANGNYQGALPAGNYVASISAAPIQFQALQNETLQLYNVGSLTVSGSSATGNFAFAPTAKITGVISGGRPLLTNIGQTGTIIATDVSGPAVTPASCCVPPTLSSASPDLLGRYQMALAQNRTFALGVDIPFTMPGTTSLAEVYFAPSSTIQLAGDTVVNLAVPGLSPPSVSIYGIVTDGAGHPLANVAVTAYSQSLTGAPGVRLSVTTNTDIYGQYRLWILSGTNYQLTLIPPAPKF